MSTGLPVLAPPWTGMADYMHPKHSRPLKYSLIEAYYGGNTQIAEVNLEHFKEELDRAYRRWATTNALGIKASKFVRKRFSLNEFGKRLDKALLEIKECENL
jgi:hypothetical protein